MAAPTSAPTTDRVHIGQPPESTIATVSNVPPATPTAPTMRRPRVSASRPPDHDADRARGVGEDREQADASGREAPLVAQELVHQLRRRRGEQAEQERGHGEEPEPPAVPRHAHVDVRHDEAPALGQVPADVAHHRQPQQAERRTASRQPRAADVGERQHPQAHADAEGPGHASMRLTAKAREPAGISSAAMIARSTAPAVVRPRTTVCEAPRVTRSGAKAPTRRDEAADGRGGEQHAPAPSAVGQRGEGQRAEDADPHGGERGALVGLAGPELVGGERDRLREQRAEVAEHDRQRAQRADGGGCRGVGRLGWRPEGRVPASGGRDRARRYSNAEGHPPHEGRAACSRCPP